MTKPLGCAIDFGTTNSSVALIYPDDVRVVRVAEEPQPFSLRSELYLHRDGQRAVGTRAGEQYSRTETVRTDGEPDSRLLKGLKHDLTDGSFKTTSWGKTFRLPELIGEVIRALKRRAEEEAGSELEKVLLSFPVAFSDGSPIGSDKHRRGLRTLEEAARWAGFAETTLLPEPEAALWALEDAVTGNALTVDFGGGTCDIALLRLPHARVADESKVLRGLPIGGERFDAKLFELKMESAFGLRNEFVGRDGKREPFPAHVRVDLRTLSQALRLMRERDTAPLLREYSAREGGDGVAMLSEILYGGHAYNFYGAIEQAKIDLSSQGEAAISFSRRPLGIAVEEEVTRPEFEDAIKVDLDRIDEAVRSVLDEAGLGPDGVDVVLRTGGSSSIPAFLDRLETLVGPEKVIARPVFTTVVYGLGLYGRELWCPQEVAVPAVRVEPIAPPVEKPPEPVIEPPVPEPAIPPKRAPEPKVPAPLKMPAKAKRATARPPVRTTKPEAPLREPAREKPAAAPAARVSRPQAPRPMPAPEVREPAPTPAPTAPVTKHRSRALALAVVGLLAAAGVAVAALVLTSNDDDVRATAPPTALATPTVAPTAPVSISEPCENSFLFAAAHQGEPGAESLLARTTELCSNLEEWLVGLRRHPGAAGLGSSSEVTPSNATSVCNLAGAAPQSQVCREAAGQGGSQ